MANDKKGVPKKDESGGGKRNNEGRGDCEQPRKTGKGRGKGGGRRQQK